MQQACGLLVILVAVLLSPALRDPWADRPAECEGHERARACIEAILAADKHRFELDHKLRAYADGFDR